jgi:hypothetical protein
MKWKLKSWIALLASCLLLWTASAEAHFPIRTYHGGFTSSEVPCDTLCTGGPLTGGLAGSLAWRMDTMENTANPDVVKLVGVNTITTPTGTLTGTDITYWNLATGDFLDFTIISSGTGAYAGAQGTLLITGYFDPASGSGVSTYVAAITLPS